MKLLVIFHLYYRDQLPWFLDKLSHVKGCDWDLLVTGPAFDEPSKAAILAFKPEARFLECENVGYDVWPFLKALQQTDLDRYDLVLKIHTKNNTGKHKVRINGVHLKEYMWRNTLVDAILQDDRRFQEVLAIFWEHPDAGMVCSRKLYCALFFKEDHALLDQELERLNLHTEDRRFCVGTMMMMRASLFKALPLDSYGPEIFPAQSASNSGGTPAHVYERVFSLLVPAQGYRVYTTGSDRSFERKQWRRKHLKPILSWIFNIDREGEEGIKYLTLFGIKIKLEDRV